MLAMFDQIWAHMVGPDCRQVRFGRWATRVAAKFGCIDTTTNLIAVQPSLACSNTVIHGHNFYFKKKIGLGHWPNLVVAYLWREVGTNREPATYKKG